MHSRRKQVGFSLIELVMVVAVGLILLAIAVPMIQSAMRNYTLNSAASNISRMVQLARYTAIRKGDDVCTVVERNMFGVDGVSDPCDGVLSDTEPRYLLPSGVALDAAGPGSFGGMNFSTDPGVPAGFVITFNSRGSTTVSPTSQVIFLAGWGRFTAVTVTGAGRARSWRYDGSSWY